MPSISRAVPLTLILLAGSALAQSNSPAAAATPGPYRVAQTFQIGGEGGWDLLAVDAEHKLLYVPRSTHTQVIGADDGKVIAEIPGQQRNHGVALVPDVGRGFITDGKDASIVVFDLKTHEVLGKVKADDDADDAVYDPASKKVLVACGDPGKMLMLTADADPKSAKVESIDLGGKPEAIAADEKGKAYVNLQDKNVVAVVDTRSGKVIDRWPVAPGGSPVGMAIDAEHRRLFIGCRDPQKLVVMSCDDGKVIADLPIGAGVDAGAFDPTGGGYAFASCRDGTLAVAHETSPGKFEIVQTVQTRSGARTMCLDPATHKLYLPTAQFEPAAPGQRRPAAKPNSFMIVVVEPSK